MADNITLDAGSGGAVVRTDDDGTAHWQYVKLAYGADNTQTIVTSTTTNPLPVALSDTDNAVLDSIAALLTTIDADTSSLAGTVGGTELQVDIVAALPAGTNAIGKLAANSGVDIGDVDVTSLPGSITGYSEDAATPATIVGIPGMMERDDALATLTPIEGDWAAFRCSAEGALWVQDFNSDAILAALGGTLTIDWNGTAPPIGAGVEATALRVTVATDSTGVLSIDDNAGSLTVDNAGTFAVQSTLQANSGVDIGDVDVTSIIPGTGATNLGKAVDAASAGTDTGVAALAVRDDALGGLTPIEGDYSHLRVDANGALWVIPNGTVTIQEASALDVSAATVTVDLGANNDVTIDASSIVLAEDAVHGSGDAGVMALSVRNDTLAALAGTDGDYAPLQVSALGALFVTLAPETTGGLTMARNVDVDETEDAVKASAGQMYSLEAWNNASSVMFLHFYNATVASVTVGTTTPDWTFAVPANSGLTQNWPHGLAFGTAITVAATTTVGGSSGPAANEVGINVGYL